MKRLVQFIRSSTAMNLLEAGIRMGSDNLPPEYFTYYLHPRSMEGCPTHSRSQEGIEVGDGIYENTLPCFQPTTFSPRPLYFMNPLG